MKSYVVAVFNGYYYYIYECAIDISVDEMKERARLRKGNLYEVDFDWRNCYRLFGIGLDDFIRAYEFRNIYASHIKRIEL